MKRNILFGFLLIGLVVMEWGCEKHSGCPDVYYKMVGVEDSKFLHKFQENHIFEAYETVSQDSTVIYVILVAEKIVAHRSSINSSVFATPPCYPPGLGDIDSIRIYNEGLDVSNEFTLLDRYNRGDTSSDRISELTDIKSSMDDGIFTLSFFKIDNPPSQTDTFQFTFQFFDTEGNMFETTTDPIVITP